MGHYKLYEATATFTATGLVLAESEKQALAIVYREMARLLEERDDAQVNLSVIVEGDYEDDYLLLNGDKSYAEAMAAIIRQDMQEVA